MDRPREPVNSFRWINRQEKAPEGTELDTCFSFADRCQLYEVKANFLSFLAAKLVERH